jgi:DNA-binding XRE family transcriptional regulator
MTAQEAIAMVRNRRLELGVRAEDAGEKAGFRPQTLRDFEQGRSVPKLDTFVAVCEALGLEVRLEPKENP